MIGRIIKKQANNFWVDAGQNTFVCTAQKKLKEHGLFVGDNVEFVEKDLQIVKALPRKNKLLRPPVCNVDALVILITTTPEPDFLLLDKLILFCQAENIMPILCHSKADLSKSQLSYLQKAYGQHFDVVEVSSINGQGVEKLKTLLKTKTCALAGQSGVGKSALINALTNGKSAIVGGLSAKIERGKNTTRHSELFKIAPQTFLADTAGFSSLDERFLNIQPNLLASYYPDFISLAKTCKFKPCTHTHEPNCAVKNAVDCGIVDKGRYERYLAILQNLQNKRQG